MAETESQNPCWLFFFLFSSWLLAKQRPFCPTYCRIYNHKTRYNNCTPTESPPPMQYVLLPLQMFLLTILQEILERERKMVITLWPDCEPTIAVFALFIYHLSTPAFFFSACLLYFPWNQGRQLDFRLSPQASDCKVHKQACFTPPKYLALSLWNPWTLNTECYPILVCPNVPYFRYQLITTRLHVYLEHPAR